MSQVRFRKYLRGAALVIVATLLLALPVAMSVDTEVTIVNDPPVLVSVLFTSTSLTTAAFSPTAASTTAVTVTISATDLNGGADLTSATVLVRKPDDSTHIASTAATANAPSGLTRTFTYTFNMEYWHAPTSGVEVYDVIATVTDAASETDDNSLLPSTFTYSQLAALSVTEGTINFGGTLGPGDTSSIESTTVVNRGNVQIDAQVSGTDLTSGANSIPVSAISHSLNPDMSSSSALSTSAATQTGFDLAKSADGSASSKSVYWQLTVPSVPAGTYTGTATVGATAG